MQQMHCLSLDEIEQIANGLIRKHLGARTEWSFRFNQKRDSLGVCIYRQRRIEMSAHWAAQLPRLEIIDTLLHEVAHALAGARAAHGHIWKDAARRLGARPRACADDIHDEETSRILGRWALVDIGSGEVWRWWPTQPAAVRAGATRWFVPGYASETKGRLHVIDVSAASAELVDKIWAPAAFSNYPFLRRWQGRRERRLYLNGCGRFRVFLRRGHGDAFEVVCDKGFLSDVDQRRVRHSLALALAKIDCGSDDSFLSIFSRCPVGDRLME